MKVLWFSEKAEVDGPLYANLIRVFDIVPFVFESLAAVLELCAIYEPDLIVIDPCGQKDFDSGCIEGIKQGLPDIKICIITCDTNHSLSKKARASGADLVVFETIPPEEFMQLLEYSKSHYRAFPKEGPE